MKLLLPILLFLFPIPVSATSNLCDEIRAEVEIAIAYGIITPQEGAEINLKCAINQADVELMA